MHVAYGGGEHFFMLNEQGHIKFNLREQTSRELNLPFCYFGKKFNHETPKRIEITILKYKWKSIRIQRPFSELINSFLMDI